MAVAGSGPECLLHVGSVLGESCITVHLWWSRRVRLRTLLILTMISLYSTAQQIYVMMTAFLTVLRYYLQWQSSRNNGDAMLNSARSVHHFTWNERSPHKRIPVMLCDGPNAEPQPSAHQCQLWKGSLVFTDRNCSCMKACDLVKRNGTQRSMVPPLRF